MRRWVRLSAVVVILAAGFVVVPPPTIAWAAELETRTHRPVLDVAAESVRALGLVEESAAARAGHGHDGAESHDAHPGSGGAVLETAETALDPFTTIGVTTGSVPSAPIVVRTVTDGAWSDWMELSLDVDHRPDGEEAADSRAGHTSEPLFVGRADGYELQAPADVEDLEVHLVTEVDRRIAISDGTDPAGAAPHIAPRSSWGARAPKATPSDAGEIKLAVVHHSVNSNGYSQSEVPALLRSIQAYHMDANGWNDIAYNFAVDRFGGIWEARAGGVDRAIIGGHAYGFNTATTGVVVLGDYRGASPSSASVRAVEDLLAWKLAQHHTPTTGTTTYRSSVDTHFGPAGTPVVRQRVVGHRDVRQTSCPGDGLQVQLGSIRANVDAKTPATQTDAPAAMVPGDRNGDGREDLLLYRPGSSPERSLSGAGGSTLLGPAAPGFTVRSDSVSGLYEAIPGDFDGDGRGDVFWYAVGRRTDYIWYGTSDGGHQTFVTRIIGEYEPLVGDFDGDGRSDIFWYGPGDTSDAIWYGRGRAEFADVATRVSGVFEGHVGDFDGDRRSDIFWYAPGDKSDYVWYGGRGFASVRTQVRGVFRVIVGDFTGEGRDDVFWYRRGSGSDYLWAGAPSRHFSSVLRPVTGAYQPFVGDFDGNGFDDIFWNDGDGRLDHQWMHRSSGYVSESARIDGGWRMTAVDADGNGDDEIFSLDGVDSGRLWNRSGSGFTARSIG